MNKIFDVTGLGYTAIDYLGVVPHLPDENKKLELRGLTIQGGGPAATATVTVRRLGLSARFAGKVGDDDFGRKMLKELKSEGIDTSAVIIEAGKQSQFAFIMVDERTAARTILWTRGSLSLLEAGEVDTSIITSSRGLLIDSLEPVAALAAARKAKENEIPVVIDAGTVRDGVVDILPFCDHIVASEIFAEQISRGEGHKEALRKISSFGSISSVVTLGERGCLFLDGDNVVEVSGFKVDAVDTTGAGDVFHGAYIFAVLQGWNVFQCCVFSNAVAALKCRKPGGRAGIPGLAEVIGFLKQNRPDVDFHLG